MSDTESNKLTNTLLAVVVGELYPQAREVLTEIEEIKKVNLEIQARNIIKQVEVDTINAQ